MYEEPNNQGFTIYSKSGCPNCVTVKKQLNIDNSAVKIIDCDEYLIENRETFLKFIREKINQPDESVKIQFPFIFSNGKFIGNTINHPKITDFGDTLDF